MSELGTPRNRAERRAAERSDRRTRAKRAAGSALVVSSTALATTAALFGAAAPAGAAPQTFTVDSTSDGAATPANCTTPVANACTLRDAVAAANANAGADTINFSVSGTITLTLGELDVNEGVTISGPFLVPPVTAGVGAAMVSSTAVTVDGNNLSRIFDINGSSDVTISGLTLTHGKDSDGGAVRWGTGHLTLQNSIVTENESTGYGGGLYSEGGSEVLTVEGSQITSNKAYYGGGGLKVRSVAAVTITDSLISGNEAGFQDGTGDGGGLYIASGESYTGTVLIQHTTITGNTADGDGGGLYATSIYGTFSIEDSIISNNTATGLGGGAGLDDLYDTTTFLRTTISGNSADEDGGGIYAEDMNGGFSIVDSTITGNHAGLDSADGGGGGVFMYYANMPVQIVHSTISGNNADFGGGLYFSYIQADTTVTIVDSTIANNKALYAGGGVEWYQNSGALVIRNSTLSGNMAGLGAADVGGGLYVSSSNYGHVSIVQSTISGNSATDEGGGIFFASYYGLDIVQSTITNNTATTVGGIAMPEPETVPSAARAAHAKATKTDEPKHGKKSGSNASNASKDARKETKKASAPKGGAHTAANADISVSLVGTILAKDSGFDVGTGGTLTAASSLIGTRDPGTAFVDSGGNLIGLDPLLAALANNGGPTQTNALTDVSPAINTGPVTVPTFPGNAYDQRGAGFPRVTNGRVDIGAYETPQVVVILPAFTG